MIKTDWITGEAGLTDVHMIRRRVFIEEQGVPEDIELDGTDGDAFHLIVYDGKTPVATGRLRIINGEYTLGRIAVLREYRGRHYGDFIVRLLIRRAFELGGEKQYVHAQLPVQGFYEKLGFTVYGGVYAEADIPHISMVRTGDISSDTDCNI